jgi:hypothetical protein
LLTINIDSQTIDTKRPSIYSKQKKFKTRNDQLKVSKTTKEETVVNSIERMIVQKLKRTQRAFGTNVVEERLKLIEE